MKNFKLLSAFFVLFCIANRAFCTDDQSKSTGEEKTFVFPDISTLHRCLKAKPPFDVNFVPVCVSMVTHSSGKKVNIMAIENILLIKAAQDLSGQKLDENGVENRLDNMLTFNEEYYRQHPNPDDFYADLVAAAMRCGSQE